MILTDDAIAEASAQHIPCDDGFYWRPCRMTEYVHAVKDGRGAASIHVSGDDTTHLVFLVAERQGPRP